MPIVRLDDLYLLAVIACIELARRIPFLPLADWFPRAIGTTAFHLSRTKRHRIDDSLKIAFEKGQSATARRTIARESFLAFWDDLFAWARPASFFYRNARVIGIEHLQDALAAGRGVILWESNGYGKRTAAQAILHEMGFAVTQVHAFRHIGGVRAGDNRTSRVFLQLIHAYFDKLERTRVSDILYLPQDRSLGFTRTLAAKLAQNVILCVAMEGPVGHKHITLPFLGQYFSFATGMPHLSQLAGAPLIPFYCTVEPNGGYLVEILPPLIPPPGSERTFAASALAAQAKCLEERIRLHPGWFRHWDSPQLTMEKARE